MLRGVGVLRVSLRYDAASYSMGQARLNRSEDGSEWAEICDVRSRKLLMTVNNGESCFVLFDKNSRKAGSTAIFCSIP